MPYPLQHLDSEAALAASFDLMRVLRPHLTSPAAYVAQVARQTEQGYRLLAAWDAERIVGLAGYRELETCSTGASSTSMTWS